MIVMRVFGILKVQLSEMLNSQARHPPKMKATSDKRQENVLPNSQLSSKVGSFFGNDIVEYDHE
jgi:hypothetical protein